MASWLAAVGMLTVRQKLGSPGPLFLGRKEPPLEICGKAGNAAGEEAFLASGTIPGWLLGGNEMNGGGILRFNYHVTLGMGMGLPCRIMGAALVGMSGTLVWDEGDKRWLFRVKGKDAVRGEIFMHGVSGIEL